MSLPDSISQAIAHMEGFYSPGTIAQRQNNPGNLRSWGTYPVVNGYVQFPDAAAGWSALNQQVNLNISRGLTLQEFFGGKPGVYDGYAPSADANNPKSYAQYVAGQVGIDPTVPLSQLGSSVDSGTLDSPDVAGVVSPFENGGASDEGSIDYSLLASLGIIAALVYFALSDIRS